MRVATTRPWPPGERLGVTGVAQVVLSLSLFLLFAFSVICLDLVLDTKSFLLLLIIIIGTSWVIPKPFTKDQNYWTYIN